MKRGGLSRPAPTVLTSSPHRWVDATGKTMVTLSIKEHAALQSSPPECQFSRLSKHALTEIGNAIPRLLSFQISHGHQCFIELRNELRNPVPWSPHCWYQLRNGPSILLRTSTCAQKWTKYEVCCTGGGGGGMLCATWMPIVFSEAQRVDHVSNSKGTKSKGTKRSKTVFDDSILSKPTIS